MKYINKTTVVSVVAGLTLWGLGVYALKKYGGATGAQVAATVAQ